MKKILLQIFKLTYFAGCFWYLFTIPAQAYIDPSAVTYIIQAVAGVLIALGARFSVTRFLHSSRKTKRMERQKDQRSSLRT